MAQVRDAVLNRALDDVLAEGGPETFGIAGDTAAPFVRGALRLADARAGRGLQRRPRSAKHVVQVALLLRHLRFWYLFIRICGHGYDGKRYKQKRSQGPGTRINASVVSTS